MKRASYCARCHCYTGVWEVFDHTRTNEDGSNRNVCAHCAVCVARAIDAEQMAKRYGAGGVHYDDSELRQRVWSVAVDQSGNRR